MVAYNLKALDPNSLREVKYYPRVIKYDSCDCGNRKLEKSPRCSDCKNHINGVRVGKSNIGRININKSAFYTSFLLSFGYLYIYLPIFLR